MGVLIVCRICLCTDSKLYKLDTYNLKKYYDELMSKTFREHRDFPQHVCYRCAALLRKCHKFKELCHYSHTALTGVLRKGQITQSAINGIKSKNNPILKFNKLQILKINERIETYCFEYDPEENILDITTEDIVEINYSDTHFSDDDFCVDSGNTEEEAPKLILDVDLDSNIKVLEPFCDDVTTEPKPTNSSEEKKEEVPRTRLSKVNKAKTSKVKRIKKKKIGRKRKYESESDEEDNMTLKEAASLKDRKNVEFTKAKGGKPKVLKFLESGFWKKSFLSDEEAIAEFNAKANDKKYLRAAYKCTDCYRGFSQKSMLDRHIPLKHGEALGSLVCRFCKCRFKTAYFLNKHMRLHYTKYECLRCNLVCNIDKSALFHEEYHNGVIRKCPHCDKEFKHMSTFYTHLRTHRSKHMCSRCGESFVSQLGLYLHKKVKHINDDNSVDVEQSTYCDVCKIKFETSDAYNRHLLHSAMHTEDKILEEDTAVKEIVMEDVDGNDLEDLQNTEELYTRKSRVEKTLSAVRKRNLYKGQPKVVRKPTTCQHCGKHFESQTACMKHHHSEHPRKPFYLPKDRVICEVCGVSLAPSSVPAHLNQHTRRKMYTCDTCGRSFTTNNMLRNHIVTHTGERNHGCTICGKRFAQSGSLNLHHRTVHLKEPYPKRNRRKKIEEPITEAGPFSRSKEDYKVWQCYFDNANHS